MDGQGLTTASGKVRVCLSPALLPHVELADAHVVVIDVLRATTSMCVAFGHGASEIVPVEQVEQCYPYIEQGYIAAAERNGETVPGFQMGNSPYSFMGDHMRGARIVVTTTNGTQALHAARSAREVLIGSFANMSVLVDYLLRSDARKVIMLCAGWKNNVNLEDSVFAGAMVGALESRFAPGDDASTIAYMLHRDATANLRDFFRRSIHRDRLLQLGLQRDVKYCLRQDTHPVLPVFKDGRITNRLVQPV